MARREVFPIINCRDLSAMKAFYEAAFGGVQTYQFPEQGEPAYLTLRVGASTIALGGGTEPAMYGETPLPATGHAIDLCVYVPHLDALLSDVAQHGGAVVVPAAEMPWGERVAYVRDPEGTMLLVIQDVP
ncbi:glyoxalase/bleomycin resistance/extradiol dioxygenase family protein [Salinibacterium sp. ZJ450]|uniref:VOC family protein n=1 Tax=Salinibacterium sp. ZJ450 TaxID=2708338 RepID=UPI0014227445|nr:VOC family protein [Salinibacterium sp. ZJ450]